MLASFLLAAACRTTSATAPAGLREVTATRAKLMQSFEVRSRAVLAGYVLRYASDEEPPRTYFVVRNREHQDLGLVDALGRAWCYRAHEREPEWITTGTVLQGARAILGVEADVVLVEL
ncbi:MAG: hypothetical protein HZA53_01035, partial [Planctomycetes bacterium]|nr:hypothetical protein [Planctomycetota bacterium]